MTYTIKIDISKRTYLADYFAAKYGAGILHLPKGHLINRKLRFILKSDDKFIRNYREDFIEMVIPSSDHIDIRKFNKLSGVGENEIIATLRDEMWMDFEDFAIKCNCLRTNTIIHSFLEDHGLSVDCYDMFRKHLQRIPAKTEKVRKKVASCSN